MGQNVSSVPHEHVWSLPVNAGIYRCLTCGIERKSLSTSEPTSTLRRVADFISPPIHYEWGIRAEGDGVWDLVGPHFNDERQAHEWLRAHLEDEWIVTRSGGQLRVASVRRFNVNRYG